MSAGEDSREMLLPRVDRRDRRVVLGVCAMDKKILSRPMVALLTRLRDTEFRIVRMGTEIVTKLPIERWPVVDCLIAFYSKGFPLYKAEQYASLRQPLLINDLAVQRMLWDRRYVYRVLQDNGIPVPRHVFVSRDLGHIHSHDEPPEGWEGVSRPAPATPGRAMGASGDGPWQSPPRSPAPGGSPSRVPLLGMEALCALDSPAALRRRAPAPPVAPSEPEAASGTVNPAPRPHHADGTSGDSGEEAGDATGFPGLIEEVFCPAIEDHDDFVVINGMRMNKPLVEKPVDAEDHNIRIYYPRSMGGGCKMLFRKVKNRSSSFDPEVNRVRQEGSFIYEEFLTTQGTDIKVYTVGPDYAHAEARKSPALDGRVMRDREGKEVRVPILLSAAEKQIAWKVSAAFQQTICGFDLLRTVHGRSYVCDVNGFSFVKSSTKYHDDCAQILRRTILRAVAPELVRAPRHSMVVRGLSPRAGNDLSPRDAAAGRGPALGAPGAARAHAAAGVAHLPSAGAAGSPSAGDADSPDASVAGLGECSTDYTSRYPAGAARDDEELRCVMAVLRHGDRTPKQKMKMRVAHPAFLGLFDRFGGRSRRRELKLKSAPQLKEVLHITRSLIEEVERGASVDSDDEGALSLRKLRQMRDVLEQGGGFSGINRKIQLKPLAWEQGDGGETPPLDAADAFGAPPGLDTLRDAPLAGLELLRSRRGSRTGEATYSALPSRQASASSTAASAATPAAPQEQVTEALLVLKWGGVLTDGGAEQAVQLGTWFRHLLYPGESEGFLRLHSTYRHDLKIYASDEGRVQMTAAAFCKGFLDLEGPLTPILASLVRSGRDATRLLDDSTAAASHLKRVKAELHSLLLAQDEPPDAEFLQQLVPTGAQSIREALASLGTPVSGLRVLLAHMRSFVESLKAVCASEEDRRRRLYQGETLGMVMERWSKLLHDFYRERKDRFDLSKVPDVFDCIKHDMLHNAGLAIPSMRPLYDTAKALADVVIPQEYGITPEDKLAVGAAVARDLVRKLRADLLIAADLAHGLDDVAPEVVYCLDKSQAKQLAIKSPGRNVRTRLYHTSESHIHTLLNLLRHFHDERGHGFVTPEAEAELSALAELDYLSHVVFRLYERRELAAEDPAKFRVELLFSQGTVAAPDLIDTHLARSRAGSAEEPETAAEPEDGAEEAAAPVPAEAVVSMHALPPAPLIPLNLSLTLTETRELMDALLAYCDARDAARPESPRSTRSGEAAAAAAPCSLGQD